MVRPCLRISCQPIGTANPVGSNSNDTLNSGGGAKFFLVKRPDGGTSNVWYIAQATSGELIEYGTKMAQTADAVFMPVESQKLRYVFVFRFRL